MSTDDGRSTALELIGAADVFITNVRPGALRRIGLDFEDVAALNPRLVYGLITGYGETGPDADRAAYDVAAYWARAGLAHLLTRPGDTPPFQRGGMGDHTAGMTLAAAVCAALVARARTGTGQLVSTSLYRQGAYTISFDLNTFLLTGHSIAIGQRESMANPCMNNYTAGDGRRFWIVGLQVDRHWGPLCRVVGRADWLTEYPRARDRAANARALIAELDEIFATKPLDEWAKLFATNRISSGHRSTRSRMWWPTNSSTPRAASSMCPTATPAFRWSPRPSTSTAPRGHPARRRPASASTPTRSSASFTDCGETVTLSRWQSRTSAGCWAPMKG